MIYFATFIVVVCTLLHIPVLIHIIRTRCGQIPHTKPTKKL